MGFIKYFKLRNDDFIFSPEGDFVERVAKMYAAKFDAAVVKTVIEVAEREGITDLYLIDEEFVKTALLNEVERRKAAEENV